ncbi:MAG: ribosome silencing factor [Bacteroidota bacterium]|jgi:ribosome-associated protein
MPASRAKTSRATSKKAIKPKVDLLEAIILGAQEKKAKDLVVLDLKSTGSSLADFFVVCHGDSKTQVDAIAHSVEDEVYKLTGERPVYTEGFTNSEWILLDYINIVVHVFHFEQRDYYGIEKFWADAKTKKIA